MYRNEPGFMVRVFFFSVARLTAGGLVPRPPQDPARQLGHCLRTRWRPPCPPCCRRQVNKMSPRTLPVNLDDYFYYDDHHPYDRTGHR